MVIVGRGRLGGAWAQALANAGEDVTLLGRGEWPPVPGGEGPVVVATRTDDLAEVLGPLRPHARRVVLIQNGDLFELASRAGVEGATLGVVWTAVARRGDAPVVGRPTPLWGPQAGRLARALSAGGLAAQEVGEPQLRRELALKLTWLAVVPVLAAREGTAVGEVGRAHAGEVEALAGELLPIAAERFGVELPVGEGTTTLLAYTEQVANFPGGAREVHHRGGLLLRWGHAQGRAQPRHEALLAAVGALGACRGMSACCGRPDPAAPSRTRSGRFDVP